MTTASTQEQPQLHPFYRADGESVQRAIAAKLSSSDWEVWSYLQLRDPFGDRYVDFDVDEVAAAVGRSKRTVQRSLGRLKQAGLWDWQPKVFEGRNPYGKAAIAKREVEENIVEFPTATETTDLPEPALTTNLSQPEPLTDKGDDKSVAISTNLSQSPPDDDKSVAISTNLSSLRQICRENDKFVAINAQKPCQTRAENLSDYSDYSDYSDRAEAEEKINSSKKEELVPEEAIAQIFGVGIEALKRAGIHAYEQAGIETIDRTTARVRYANHPPFVQLLAWAMQQNEARGDRFHQTVMRWLAFVRGSDRPIRNPYGNLRAFVRNELED